MQQITVIAQTPMNERVAKNTIEDHKYLLESVENRCAFAFFSVSYRNNCLYDALQKYYKQIEEEKQAIEEKETTTKLETNLKKGKTMATSGG